MSTTCSANYLWDGEKVIVYQERLHYENAIELGLIDMPCVDGFRPITDPQMRYGVFKGKKGWFSMSLEAFPSEFRMHLLLLGVP